MDTSSAGEGNVQVRFSTKQEQYALQDVPYTVNVNVTSSGLNKIVNTLLEQSHLQTANFDFLVYNQYLHASLLEHLKENAISLENVIDVEYVEKFPAPEPQDCLLHDDWVNAVKTQGNWILSGCYDHTVNIWTTKGTHVLTIPGHTMPVKAVTWVSLDDQLGRFISVSQDQTALLWEWNIGENSIRVVCLYKGHQRAIDCVDVCADTKRMVTGSWDTMIKIWSTDENEKAFMRNDPDHSTVRTPVITLQGHKESVSAVQWMDSETLLSASWDHTIKIWNMSLEGIQSEIVASKSFFDASYSKLNKLIIAAFADKNLCLYDSRTNQGSVVRNTYVGHSGWIQTVTWSKTEEHLFFSGSYDNKSKLWDLRSPKAPLYDLIGHSDKVLDVDWSNPKFFVSGGADNVVRIFKSRKALGQN